MPNQPTAVAATTTDGAGLRPFIGKTGWSRSIAVALGLWAVSRFTLGLIGACSFALDGLPVPWLHMWVQWDAGYYLSIMDGGYLLPTLVTGEETGQSNLNFFPLFPMGARLLMRFGLAPVQAALVFSNTSLVMAALALHRLAAWRFGEKAGDWSVLSLMFLPGSFSLSGVMTEPVFLALSCWSLYLARQGCYSGAAMTGAFLLVTRVTGIALTAALALDWMLSRLHPGGRGYRDLFLILLTPLPLLCFMAYLHAHVGDGLAFVHSQFAFWHHRIGLPFQNFFLFAWTDQPRLWLQSAVALILILAFLSRARQMDASEILFVLLNVLSFASSLSAAPSLLRYMISLYPVHLAVGLLCEQRPSARLFFLVLAMLNGALMLLWVRGNNAFI